MLYTGCDDSVETKTWGSCSSGSRECKIKLAY
jgi:hypothetical protein